MTHSNGFLHVFTGPMASGKTSRLLSKLNMYTNITGVKALMIQHQSDSRDFLTHSKSGSLNPLIDVVKVEHLKNVKNYEDYDVIGIDEGQFFDDLFDTFDDIKNS